MKEVIGCVKVDEFYRENGMTKWDDWHTVAVVLSDDGKSLERDYSYSGKNYPNSAVDIFSRHTDADVRNHPLVDTLE